MILISVDLPAPLSPSRPSTSPLRRCRFTSRSAVTGPKRLAMCSTRNTSSGADATGTTGSGGGAWPGCGAWAPSAATGLPPADAADEHVRGHRDDHCEARVEDEEFHLDAIEALTVLMYACDHPADSHSHH